MSFLRSSSRVFVLHKKEWHDKKRLCSPLDRIASRCKSRAVLEEIAVPEQDTPHTPPDLSVTNRARCKDRRLVDQSLVYTEEEGIDERTSDEEGF